MTIKYLRDGKRIAELDDKGAVVSSTVYQSVSKARRASRLMQGPYHNFVPTNQLRRKAYTVPAGVTERQ